MAAGWHYMRAGKQYGPVSSSALKKLADAGQLSQDDLVWKEGLANWAKASSIKGLFPVVQQAPPPPPLRASSHPAAEPDSVALGSLTPDMHAKAEHNHLQATFKLIECQSHLQVYGTRLTDVARDGLQFIEAALEINPDSAPYWDTKGLLLTDGLGDHQRSLRCLKRALELEPDSIVIKQNIRNVENALKGCLGMACVILLGGALGLYLTAFFLAG